MLVLEDVRDPEWDMQVAEHVLQAHAQQDGGAGGGAPRQPAQAMAGLRPGPGTQVVPATPYTAPSPVGPCSWL